MNDYKQRMDQIEAARLAAAPKGRLPDDLRAEYYARFKDAPITIQISANDDGFSISREDIAQYRYHRVREAWEADGYYDPVGPFKAFSLLEREKKFADAILDNTVTQ